MEPVNVIKKEFLGSVFANYLKFFVHISPHPDVVIGSRGFIDEEKIRGIVLVFGTESYRNLIMQDTFLSVVMKFSGKWEEVFIPYEAIAAIFNDPVSPEFIVNFRIISKEQEQTNKQQEVADKHEGKLIRHDFSKKK